MRFFIFSLLILTQISAISQSYDLGLNPPAIKWRQIDTDKVRVIFPDGMEPGAQRVANLVHLMYDSNYYSLGEQKGKVDMILQNQSMIPNGFVTVGPFRSEMITSPPQLNYTGHDDWLDLLTIHEYRHIHQYLNAKRGITKLGSWLGGEYSWGSLRGLAVPSWFSEGDAVYMETMLTSSGRGRFPDFNKDYRTLLMNDITYSYEKAWAGSYKHFVPSFYNTGYYMTTHLRQEEGTSIWSDISNDAVRYKGLLFPFSQSLKKRTGGRTKHLYESTMTALKDKWASEGSQTDQFESNQINEANKKTFTSYHNPTFLDDSTLVASKRSFNAIETYYQIDLNGNEKRLTTPGIYYDENATLSHFKGSLIWSEYRPHERWGNQSYHVIMKYDPVTHRNVQLTTKSKLLAPVISPDGRLIAAVSVGENYEFNISILDSQDGRELKQIKNQSNYHYSFPTWSDENELITVVKKEGKMALIQINIESEIHEELTDYFSQSISYPKNHGNHIYFHATFSGIDNIYMLDKVNSLIYQVTFSDFGATQPSISPDGQTLVYTDYGPLGYDLKSIPIIPSHWKPMNDSNSGSINFLSSADSKYVMDDVPENTYQVKPYKKVFDGMSVHSWVPLYIPPNLSFKIYANNLLSTVSAVAGVQLLTNENNSLTYDVNLRYGDLFTPIEIGYAQNQRSRYLPVYREIALEDDTAFTQQIIVQDWDEEDISLGLVLPLNMVKGPYFGNFTLAARFHQITARNTYDSDETFGAFDLTGTTYIVRRTSQKQVNPRFGQYFSWRYASTLSTSLNESNYFRLTSLTYLPGLWKTHSFYIISGYQSEPFTAKYKFVDDFYYARGYAASAHDKVWRFGINYELPLLYPDLAIVPILFIKRIKSNFFYDFSQATTDRTNLKELTDSGSVPHSNVFFPEFVRNLRSVGVELTCDFRAFRLVDVEAGYRISYLLDDTGLESIQYNALLLSFTF